MGISFKNQQVGDKTTTIRTETILFVRQPNSFIFLLSNQPICLNRTTQEEPHLKRPCTGKMNETSWRLTVRQHQLSRLQWTKSLATFTVPRPN